MSAFKQFLASDIIITPFEVNKNFNCTTDAEGIFIINGETDPCGIDRFLGIDITEYIFDPNSDPTSGYLSTQYQRLTYNSIQELYYSNYYTSQYGDDASQRILIPGRDKEGDRYIGSVSSTAYDNYLQTTLSYPKNFPPQVTVISIPQYLFGDYIQPNSFICTVNSLGKFIDDGEGNVVNIKDNNIVGNIFYPHGTIVITDKGKVDNFYLNKDCTLSFSSSFQIQETQYKCTIRENEFNLTLNPSVISSSADGTVYDYVTQRYFAPYITTIGLYDEAQNLLAIGKLAQPLPSSLTTDTTILINLDR
jgi:hypothetical protein